MKLSAKGIIEASILHNY